MKRLQENTCGYQYDESQFPTIKTQFLNNLLKKYFVIVQISLCNINQLTSESNQIVYS